LLPTKHGMNQQSENPPFNEEKNKNLKKIKKKPEIQALNQVQDQQQKLQ